MEPETIWLCLLFVGIAAVYSAAGFGGGSSYLALLSLSLDQFATMRTLALLCNLVVVSGSVSLYWRHGFLEARRLLPLVLLSVPAAFVAAQLRFAESTFFVILGLTLVLASIAMLGQRPQKQTVGSSPRNRSVGINALLGGGVGFLAGLVGIGGGIFLSPLLHLIHWDTAKRIAAVASFFILVNSFAGLLGLLASGQFQVGHRSHWWLLVAVLIGGQLGVRFCLGQVASQRIRKLTAVLVMVAGARILWGQLG